MATHDEPTFGNEKICYLQIPALDIRKSADFFHQVFGWKLRVRGENDISFDDGVGEVSGSWVLDRKPATEPGIMISIMVDDAALTVEKIVAHGGKILRPIGADAPEITATFSDLAGNVLGIYQHRR